jgi:hypothetical protein
MLIRKYVVSFRSVERAKFYEYQGLVHAEGGMMKLYFDTFIHAADCAEKLMGNEEYDTITVTISTDHRAMRHM